jgi:hypothetical protein
VGELCATPLSGQVKSSHGSQVKLGRWLSSAVCFRYMDNGHVLAVCERVYWRGMAGHGNRQRWSAVERVRDARGADAVMDHGSWQADAGS